MSNWMSLSPFTIDKSSSRPLYRQIAESLADQIRSGGISAGTLLPPTRKLVEIFQVNRSTAVAAYEALEKQGLVRSKVGRGTEVLAPEVLASDRTERIWDERSSAGLRLLVRQMDDLSGEPLTVTDQVCDFSRLAPDTSLFPVEPLRSSLNSALDQSRGEILQYGSGQGYAPLRETISTRMKKFGVAEDPDRIVIVSGAQQGLDLILRAFASPADGVAVETPTYSGILPLLGLGQLDVLPVPMTPEGADLDRLEQIIVTKKLRLFYTMPSFHNPTGITTSREHRHRLTQLARTHGFLIIEDGFEDELGFGAETPRPLCGIDPGGAILYLGTFSKGLFPGVRVGWISGEPDAIRRLAALKSGIDYGAPLLLQAAVDDLCRTGEYDRHLTHLRKVYSGRRKALAKAFEKHLPASCRSRFPEGGFAVWIDLPSRVSADQVARETALEGVYVSPASRFTPAGMAPVSGLRLSVSRVGNWEIDRGIKILGRIITRLIQQGERSSRAAAVPTL